MLEVNNTVVIKLQFNSMYSSNYIKLVIDCPSHSNIIISDENNEPCEEVPNHFSGIPFIHKFPSQIKWVRKLTDVYINVNSMLTCESFMVDSECLYMVFPHSKITFKFNDCEIIILLQKESLTFTSVLASMYATWLSFCGYSEQVWLANVLAQPQGSGKPSIEILTKTLQGLYSSKQFNLKDFDIKKIPYIKDVYKNCTYEFLDDTIHLLDKEQIISIIEELGEEDGERKAQLIQAAGLKDNDERRFEL